MRNTFNGRSSTEFTTTTAVPTKLDLAGLFSFLRNQDEAIAQASCTFD